MAKTVQGLPRDARKLVRDFERQVQAVWDRAEAEVAALRKELGKTLKAALNTHAKAGRFDEALAVREQMNQFDTVMRPGRTVEVESEGGWWEAEILEVRGSRYRVHYVGWGDEWDEWVGKDRLRFPGSTKRARQKSPAHWNG
jgi:pentatricopeptide repeat protein